MDLSQMTRSWTLSWCCNGVRLCWGLEERGRRVLLVGGTGITVARRWSVAGCFSEGECSISYPACFSKVRHRQLLRNRFRFLSLHSGWACHLLITKRIRQKRHRAASKAGSQKAMRLLPPSAVSAAAALRPKYKLASENQNVYEYAKVLE